MRPARLLGFCLLLFLFLHAAQASSSDLVYVVPVEGSIDPALEEFVERGFKEAEDAGAKAIILEINTPGGLVQAAQEIKDAIFETRIPRTVALVQGGAISAGALLALSADSIYMTPGSTMGGAEPRLGSVPADEKIISIWAAQLGAAAEANGRNPMVAAAMADADIEIPGVVARGKLLTLGDAEAKKLGISDLTVSGRQQVLVEIGLTNARVVEVQPSLAEKAARLVTSPYVAPLLFALGIAGLVLEAFTPGLGVPGILGLLLLGIYFGGHLLAGVSGWEAVVLFASGVLLLLLEILVLPGFGVAGILGMAALVGAVFLTTGDFYSMLGTLFLALGFAVIAGYLSWRFLPGRRVWQRLVLFSRLERGDGYTTVNHQDVSGEHIGRKGVALTNLRPAGVVALGNLRVDVVTEGGFISRGAGVYVVRIEGSRVIVRAVEEEKEDKP